MSKKMSMLFVSGFLLSKVCFAEMINLTLQTKSSNLPQIKDGSTLANYLNVMGIGVVINEFISHDENTYINLSCADCDIVELGSAIKMASSWNISGGGSSEK